MEAKQHNQDVEDDSMLKVGDPGSTGDEEMTK